MSDLVLPEPLCTPEFLTALGLHGLNLERIEIRDCRVCLDGPAALPGFSSDPTSRCTGLVLRSQGLSLDTLTYVLEAGGLKLVEFPGEGQGAVLQLATTTAKSDFDSADWSRRLLPIWLRVLPDIPGMQNKFTAEELRIRMPMILSRAYSQAMAATDPRVDRSGFTRQDVELEAFETPYVAYFAVNEYRIRHRTYDGGSSNSLGRVVFMAADAVTVLPYDPKRDNVLLVEQFRAGPYARGDATPWLLEPIAGRIEPGDTPEETAEKEASEEAGLTLQALHRIGGYYPSTGCFSEYLHSFIGIADLPEGTTGLHGVEEEGEDIRSIVISRADLLARIEAGELPDGPLLLSAYWLELNRAQLVAG